MNSYADFWSWFRIGFLPLAVQHTWAFSEGLNETHPGDSTFLGAFGGMDFGLRAEGLSLTAIWWLQKTGVPHVEAVRILFVRVHCWPIVWSSQMF